MPDRSLRQIKERPTFALKIMSMEQETTLTASLKKAEADIAEVRAHIASQEWRVQELERHGVESSSARRILEQYYELLVMQEDHRDRILNALAEEES